MNVLLLGGAGFIGGHLQQRLLATDGIGRIEVAGFHAGGGAAIGVHPVEGPIDAKLLARCARPDAVAWLAGGSSVGRSVTDPQWDFARGLPPLTALLARMGGDWRGARLLFVSSAAVYGRSGSRYTRVDSALEPISPYGANKKASEDLVRLAVAELGLPATIARPFSVYGPGLRRQLFWDAAAKAARGEWNYSGSGEELRDWVYVADLVDLLRDIMLAPQDFPALLNASGGNAISNREVLGTFFAAMGHDQAPRFDGSTRVGDPPDLVADAGEQAGLARYFRTPVAQGLVAYRRWLVEAGAACA